MSDLVLLAVDGPVATVTLNRAEKRNAIAPAMLAEADALSAEGIPRIPTADTVLQPGDEMIAVIRTEAEPQLRQLVSDPAHMRVVE